MPEPAVPSRKGPTAETGEDRQPAQKDFLIEVGDEKVLTVEEIWPDGDAPENPTVDDVIAQIRKTSPYYFASDWGFEQHVTVNGKPVIW